MKKLWGWLLDYTKEEIKEEIEERYGSYRESGREIKKQEIKRRIDWGKIERKMEKMREYINWDNAIGMMIFGIVSFMIFLGGFLIWKSVNASGEMEYCYVERFGGGAGEAVDLMGKIEWRPDRNMGRFNTLEEAVKGAGMIGCKLKGGDGEEVK